MENQFTLQELHQLKARINKEIDEATRELYEHLNTVDELIKEFKDGYIYWVCIKSYGSARWVQFHNPNGVRELIDEYGDGYDGMLAIYSNNPRFLKKVGKCTYMCDRYYTLDDLPEGKRDIQARNNYSSHTP